MERGERSSRFWPQSGGSRYRDLPTTPFFKLVVGGGRSRRCMGRPSATHGLRKKREASILLRKPPVDMKKEEER